RGTRFWALKEMYSTLKRTWPWHCAGRSSLSFCFRRIMTGRLGEWESKGEGANVRRGDAGRGDAIMAVRGVTGKEEQCAVASPHLSSPRHSSPRRPFAPRPFAPSTYWRAHDCRQLHG